MLLSEPLSPASMQAFKCWLCSSPQSRRRALAEADEQLPALERELPVSDILTCRRTAQRVLEASLAAASGMGDALEGAGAAAASARRSRGRGIAPLPPSLVGGQGGQDGEALGGAAGSPAGVPATGPGGAPPPPRPASLGGSSSAASSSLAGGPAATAGSGGRQRRRGYLAWGLSKAASLLRYMPYSAANEVGVPCALCRSVLPAFRRLHDVTPRACALCPLRSLL